MDLMACLSYIGAGWWFIGTFGLIMTSVFSLLQPLVQARRAKARALPPISAILPIKLVNPGFETAQASIFTQTYPAYEVLFSAAESSSPAVDSVGALTQAYPKVESRILQSRVEIAVSPKLNTLATPLKEAAHDLILTKDSNIVLSPDMMEALAQNMTEGVGLVCCVPVAENAEGLAGEIEATLINGHARLLLTGSFLGMGFGVGKVMLFRRSDLARAGGIEAVAYTIAEDTAISRGLAASGLKTVFAHRTARQEIGRRTLREIFERQLRWGVIRRSHETLAFCLEPLSFPLMAALAGAAGAPLADIHPVLAFTVTLGTLFCCEIGIARAKGWQVPNHAFVAFLGREILAITAWLRAWTTYRVVWANGHFNLSTGMRAQPSQAAFAMQRQASGINNG